MELIQPTNAYTEVVPGFISCYLLRAAPSPFARPKPTRATIKTVKQPRRSSTSPPGARGLKRHPRPSGQKHFVPALCSLLCACCLSSRWPHVSASRWCAVGEQARPGCGGFGPFWLRSGPAPKLASRLASTRGAHEACRGGRRASSSNSNEACSKNKHEQLHTGRKQDLFGGSHVVHPSPTPLDPRQRGCYV